MLLFYYLDFYYYIMFLRFVLYDVFSLFFFSNKVSSK